MHHREFKIMRRIAVVLMLLVLALSALAVADTAQLTFTGPGVEARAGYTRILTSLPSLARQRR
jgi:hypothetical protein